MNVLSQLNPEVWGILEDVKKLPNQEEISSLNPTRIGSVNGLTFYENPFMGDEAPLMVLHDGLWCETGEFDLPQ